MLGFSTKWNHHVFIHPPGDEIWLSFTAFPFDSSYFRLEVNNRDEMSSTDLAITEKEIVFRHKESSPCKYYNDQVIFDLLVQSFDFTTYTTTPQKNSIIQCALFLVVVLAVSRVVNTIAGNKCTFHSSFSRFE